jgi:hypothetical protein
MDRRTALIRAARAAWKPLLAVAALLGGAGLWLFAISSLSDGDDFSPDEPANHPFVYVEFGVHADTVWIAAGSDPSERIEALTVPHAPEYGAFFSLAPDGQRIAYTVLPPGTPAPSPDAPAELWIAYLQDETAPRRVAADADLLVEPVWSPDGASLVFRRSDSAVERAGEFSLVALELRSGRETILAATSDVALFPVAFSDGGASFSYATLSPSGSDLQVVELATGSRRTLRLSDELTRDWELTQAGDRLAFLVLTTDGGRYSARAATLEIETGALTIAPAGSWDELGPTWTADGAGLTFGRLTPGLGGSAVVQTGGRTTALAGPALGFDVPLAWSADGALLAVQTFDGASITEPGRSALALVGRDGSRDLVAAGEVTFVGWLN